MENRSSTFGRVVPTQKDSPSSARLKLDVISIVGCSL
jgi:hypothetical protein